MDRENVTFEEYYLSRNLWMPVQKCRGVHVCAHVCVPVHVWVGVCVDVCVM